MKQFFTFDRRKKEPIVGQIIDQTISYINDYKLIHGTPLPDLQGAKQEFGLTDDEIQRIVQSLLDLGYLKKTDDHSHYLFQKPTRDSSFLVDVAPIYRSIKHLGMKPSIQTIKEEFITVNYELAALSGFQYEEKVLKLTKIYFGDHRPVVYGEMYFSLDKLPNVEKYIMPTEPHQDILFKQFPNSFKYHVRELNVVYMPEDVKQHLHITEEGAINTLGKYNFYNALGQTVEFGLVHLNELNDFVTTINDLSGIRL